MMHRARLFLEFLVLFVGLPVVTLFFEARMAIFGVLWAASFIGLYWLWKRHRERLFVWPSALQVKVMLGHFALLGVILTTLAWCFLPERFLSLPMERPQLFATICLLYPFLSALPQEVLYRGFFFARYKPLFPPAGLRVALSALAFALAHLAFGNWVAPVLSLLGGLLFSWRYAQTRSLPLAILEHSLYGLLIFAVGLGWYFYLGAGHRFW